MAGEFRDLPFQQLIAAPLIAAIRAHGQAAASSARFMRMFAFENAGGGSMGKAKMAHFVFFKNMPDGTKKKYTVAIPMLKLLIVPNLRVQEITVNFDVRITNTSQNKIENSFNMRAAFSANIGAIYGMFASAAKDKMSSMSLMPGMHAENKHADQWKEDMRRKKAANAMKETNIGVEAAAKFQFENETYQKKEYHMNVLVRAGSERAMPPGIEKMVAIMTSLISSQFKFHKEKEPPPPEEKKEGEEGEEAKKQ
mmetsp:Transcript_22454/g.56329  ORF Transcript_22454/g.56329 Transcript_22454/m.56329 type:complete len:253 (+) Transcript_22454:333-1091(+)|eukprot:CAMPEP_0177638658 /NCGR_PEP_ID=MMETSP0447-20121125/5609_1 /TAXON_ID=0 /ORGANISM="Stygamoeba regulata, Strain BSH-02190019" /LENGTH=252 /DNA_ID=CAMNT_0019140641 /DNA_START=259 /DNA_END=1017 /DNA_ORIENTATION=-